MRSGQRKKIIEIQTKTTIVDEYGGATETWARYKKAWASVWPLKGKDLVAAEAARNETTVRFNIRWTAGLDDSMRIVYGGKNYDITALINIAEADKEYDILAKTGVNNG